MVSNIPNSSFILKTTVEERNGCFKAKPSEVKREILFNDPAMRSAGFQCTSLSV